MSDRIASDGEGSDQAEPGGSGRAAAAVAAVLLPPLGLHLAAARAREFWIGTGLTALGFLPGVGFALWVVLSRRVVPAAA